MGRGRRSPQEEEERDKVFALSFGAAAHLLRVMCTCRVYTNTQVDKAKFLDSEFDKEMLLGKTFGRQPGARDRSGRD